MADSKKVPLAPGSARPGFLPDLAPRIETERLILRGWRIEDYEPLGRDDGRS